MNKADLVSAMANEAGITKRQAAAALDSALKNISGTLKDGESVTLIGFGTFSVSERAARQGRNPQTGEVIDIPVSKVARFKAGKALKDLVNS